ncbi:uncharacterized protein LOC105683921 isoform X3 [Athalia rosae]|uniref:uncharacterized protein LOC105683921 isoform X3 n=1 Tax=Athalia rosae TaxID=37344 RepID=UPI002033A6B2|nr:uncharacterized protein LOC105683921 isoform X3 [Athalia rosae]
MHVRTCTYTRVPRMHTFVVCATRRRRTELHCTQTDTVAMTDPQLNNNNNNNNNNDGEPKYLHKKFKKMATSEAATVESKRETVAVENNRMVTVTRGDNEKEKKGGESDEVGEESTTAKTEASPEPDGEVGGEGKKSGNVCPYCKLSCAKPSVLQKHIRAHTNERPFPCVPCGFAFKTRSNLYKHCRSRAHALRIEGGDSSKVSEDSDISLSDSASNGTGTPPPPISSSAPNSAPQTLKTVKTGKIYKPKFHTALNSVGHDSEVSSISSNSSTNSTNSGSNNKPNAEQLQEHIDKIITANQAIVDAVDPRLHKLMQRQQSLVEPQYASEQPLNLSSAEENSLQRKRCYSESFAFEKEPEGSIMKDLLSKTKGAQNSESLGDQETLVCPVCKIPYTSIDNLEAHRRYYCKGTPNQRKPEFQLDLDKKEHPDYDLKSDYYSTLQPLPSPGPLLGNTRLVDAYVPPQTKQRSESAPTTLRSLEELSKYPRPNSLQMFGGEVRILDNTGETKTMRIEPRQSNSPSSASDHVVNNKCATSETSSIVVRSGLHSGGTMVHKPPGSSTSTPSSTISLPNTPKMLAPIIPNISTPNIAPTISCYGYLEPNLNPLNNITAYNPLTLPQAGIASIFHGGKVIPHVPGMPGPHSLSGLQTGDIPTGNSTGSENSYKVIPGLPGLHVVAQPLDLASPVKIQTPNIPGIPGPHSNIMPTPAGQPLDLASPPRDFKFSSFSKPSNNGGFRSGAVNPKIPGTKNEEKFRNRTEHDRHKGGGGTIKQYKGVETPRERREFGYEKSPKSEKVFSYPNGANEGAVNTYGISQRYSPKSPNVSESRKRPCGWSGNPETLEPLRRSPILKHEPPSPHENGRIKDTSLPDVKARLFGSYDNGSMDINGVKMKTVECVTPTITVNVDNTSNFNSSSKINEVPNRLSSPGDQFVVKNINKVSEESSEPESNSKFLRPTSLPLKPGTFTPKRHHGITPTANTLPLISPETPRPRKSYGQLYLNGHAYTYLGLKCSTRVFYCTLNRPQPMYVTQQHGLSMYSNWKICKEAPPDLDMAHYDSRHRPASYTIACKKQEDILTHSSQRPTTPASPDNNSENDTQEKAKRVKIFDGGFESNEDYIYVRGRGRGRYVCEECGIRCKKPSMLKKHIRTHTDVRPYTCKHCTFSFKTKGNLTKHMKSKAHYKKCVELGVVPVPTLVCDENIDKDAVARLAAGGGNAEESSEEEEDTEGEESEESGSEEHEAAQGLLSLSQRSANRLPGLLPSGRPTTYPYTLTLSPSTVCSTVVTTTTTSAPLSSQAAAVIQSELSHRYYFPSNRSVPEKPRSSVIIQSSKKSSDSEIENDDITVVVTDTQGSSPQQPMDLTTKQTPTNCSRNISSHRVKPADILTPVSEPVLLQTIVQTMERLPVQGREWKSDAQGHMLQAYLTERHVMDSKMKLQYRVGSSKDMQTNKQRDAIRSKNLDLNGVPTVTYTDPSKMQHTFSDARIKNMVLKQNTDDMLLEIRDKMYHGNLPVERRLFDTESVYKDKENANRLISDSEGQFDHRAVEGSPIMTSKTNIVERMHFVMEPVGRITPVTIERQSPRHFNMEMINRNSSASREIKSEMDRSTMFNAIKMMNEIERPRDCHTPNIQDPVNRPPSRETRVQSHSPRSHQDLRPPSREICRTPNQEPRTSSEKPTQEFRLPNNELRIPSQEPFKPGNQDVRNTSQEMTSPTNVSEFRIQMNSETLRPPSRETRQSQSQVQLQPQDTKTNFDVISKSGEIPRTTGSQDNQKSQSIIEPRSSIIEPRNSNNERTEIKQSIDVAKQNMAENIKHSVARKMVVGGPGFRSPSPPGGGGKPQAEFLQPSTGPAPNYVSYSVTEDGRSVCGICNKVFSKPSQLRLHINIHYFERPFRCESCAVSFRTKGHLTKHERSVSHHNKVSMTSTFGAATTSNPRPFKCTDCKIAFRIHGHLAKHLRSKMHIMKLECLGKLPFGTYAEMERSGINMNDIDTSDCDNSLTSLQSLAQKLYEKDPSKMGQWDTEIVPSQGASGGETSSDEGEPIPLHPLHHYPQSISSENDLPGSRSYHMPILVSEESKPIAEIRHANPQFSHHQQRVTDFSGISEPRQHVRNVVRTNLAGQNEIEDINRVDDGIQQIQYKCSICSKSIFRTLNELQVHCFVEHNIEADSSSCPSLIIGVGINHSDRSGSEGKDSIVSGDNLKNRTQKRTNDSDDDLFNRDDLKRQKKVIDDT